MSKRKPASLPKAKAIYKRPSPQGMAQRKSSISNAFVNAILPVFPPTPEDFRKVVAFFGMDEHDERCVYCGDRFTEWDHLRPLVVGKLPTGYVTEIANLVPACGKCNQSKGNKNWRVWMLGDFPRSPAKRGVHDVVQRVAKIEAFESWLPPRCIPFEKLVGVEEWREYWALRAGMHVELDRCQAIANDMLKRIWEGIEAAQANTPS